MEEIIPYILDTYRPEAVILYGSFANGTNNAHSDFDALVIAPGEKRHDASVVAGITLDVFIYPRETFQGDYDPADYEIGRAHV